MIACQVLKFLAPLDQGFLNCMLVFIELKRESIQACDPLGAQEFWNVDILLVSAKCIAAVVDTIASQTKNVAVIDLHVFGLVQFEG